MTDEGLLIAKGRTELRLLPRLANRHGLIAGATGTGKTVTLQVMAENFSRIGVPVFMADVKGDLAGISRPGTAAGKVQERLALLGIADYPFAGCPVMFWDIFGEQGHPVRTTVTDMGPLLLGRLAQPQRGPGRRPVRRLPRRGRRRAAASRLQGPPVHGPVRGRQSGRARDRLRPRLLRFRRRHPALAPRARGSGRRPALRRAGPRTRGLHADRCPGPRLRQYPDRQPPHALAQDVRDLPALASFGAVRAAARNRRPGQAPPRFLFRRGPPAVRGRPAGPHGKNRAGRAPHPLQGRGVFFITQNPIDIPDDILGQLGNRVQHALRAFTPRDQKAVRAMAETFRQNPAVDVETAVTQLAVGEGLVSFLDEKGQPGIVERAWVLPPASRIGTITPQEREAVVRQSLVYGRYENATDRDSAYEMLRARAEARVVRPAPESRREIPPDFSVGLPEPPMRGGDRASYPGYPTPASAAPRRAARHPARGDGQKRGPLGRQLARPVRSPRRPGLDPRRPPVEPARTGIPPFSRSGVRAGRRPSRDARGNGCSGPASRPEC